MSMKNDLGMINLFDKKILLNFEKNKYINLSYYFQIIRQK